MKPRRKLAGKSAVVFALVGKINSRLGMVYPTRSEARKNCDKRNFRVVRGIFVPKGRA